MLQNAVHPLAKLRQVKLNTDQNKVAGVALTYDNYFKLLYSAAVNYDKSFSTRTARRSVLVHDVMATDTIDPDYDIDTGIDTVFANVAARSTPGTRLPASQWSELSSKARDLWQSLPEADQAIILGSTKAGPSKSS
jgi:hypothetical protein